MGINANSEQRTTTTTQTTTKTPPPEGDGEVLCSCFFFFFSYELLLIVTASHAKGGKREATTPLIEKGVPWMSCTVRLAMGRQHANTCCIET